MKAMKLKPHAVPKKAPALLIESIYWVLYFLFVYHWFWIVSLRRGWRLIITCWGKDSSQKQETQGTFLLHMDFFAAVTLIGGAGCHVQGGSHHQVSAVQAEGLWEGTVFTMMSVTILPLERLLCFAGSYAKTWWASGWWQNLPCCCATKASSTNIPEGGSSLKTFFFRDVSRPAIRFGSEGQPPSQGRQEAEWRHNLYRDSRFQSLVMFASLPHPLRCVVDVFLSNCFQEHWCFLRGVFGACHRCTQSEVSTRGISVGFSAKCHYFFSLGTSIHCFQGFSQPDSALGSIYEGGWKGWWDCWQVPISFSSRMVFRWQCTLFMFHLTLMYVIWLRCKCWLYLCFIGQAYLWDGHRRNRTRFAPGCFRPCSLPARLATQSLMFFVLNRGCCRCQPQQGCGLSRYLPA